MDALLVAKLSPEGGGEGEARIVWQSNDVDPKIYDTAQLAELCFPYSGLEDVWYDVSTGYSTAPVMIFNLKSEKEVLKGRRFGYARRLAGNACLVVLCRRHWRFAGDALAALEATMTPSLNYSVPRHAVEAIFAGEEEREQYGGLAFDASLFGTLARRFRQPGELRRMIAAVLSEQKILFVGSDEEVVSRCVLAATALPELAGLVWPHVVATTLPPKLLIYAGSPSPYLMGTHLNCVDLIEAEEFVVCHVDYGVVRAFGARSQLSCNRFCGPECDDVSKRLVREVSFATRRTDLSQKAAEKRELHDKKYALKKREEALKRKAAALAAAGDDAGGGGSPSKAASSSSSSTWATRVTKAGSKLVKGLGSSSNHHHLKAVKAVAASSSELSDDSDDDEEIDNNVDDDDSNSDDANSDVDDDVDDDLALVGRRRKVVSFAEKPPLPPRVEEKSLLDGDDDDDVDDHQQHQVNSAPQKLVLVERQRKRRKKATTFYAAGYVSEEDDFLASAASDQALTSAVATFVRQVVLSDFWSHPEFPEAANPGERLEMIRQAYLEASPYRDFAEEFVATQIFAFWVFEGKADLPKFADDDDDGTGDDGGARDLAQAVKEATGPPRAKITSFQSLSSLESPASTPRPQSARRSTTRRLFAAGEVDSKGPLTTTTTPTSSFLVSELDAALVDLGRFLRQRTGDGPPTALVKDLAQRRYPRPASALLSRTLVVNRRALKRLGALLDEPRRAAAIDAAYDDHADDTKKAKPGPGPGPQKKSHQKTKNHRPNSRLAAAAVVLADLLRGPGACVATARSELKDPLRRAASDGHDPQLRAFARTALRLASDPAALRTARERASLPEVVVRRVPDLDFHKSLAVSGNVPLAAGFAFPNFAALHEAHASDSDDGDAKVEESNDLLLVGTKATTPVEDVPTTTTQKKKENNDLLTAFSNPPDDDDDDPPEGEDAAAAAKTTFSDLLFEAPPPPPTTTTTPKEKTPVVARRPPPPALPPAPPPEDPFAGRAADPFADPFTGVLMPTSRPAPPPPPASRPPPPQIPPTRPAPPAMPRQRPAPPTFPTNTNTAFSAPHLTPRRDPDDPFSSLSSFDAFSATTTTTKPPPLPPRRS